MKKAVIYARYSSDRQTEQSIEGQLRACRAYAKNNKIIIVDDYIDRATTGTNDRRPAFQKMMYDCHKKSWDYVIVYKLDRFSRNKYEMITHKKTLKDNNIKILSATEGISESAEGILLESLLEGMAEYYSIELSQKVKRGMNESRQKGLFTGGPILYGYKVIDKKIYIDEEKAEIVRYMFDLHSSGKCVREVVEELTNRGILYKGKPFNESTVLKMLKNEKYIGIFRHEGKVFTNAYPPIIARSVFKMVQERLESNHYGKHSTTTKFLLEDKMFCGYCGNKMIPASGSGNGRVMQRYYRCSGRVKLKKCHKGHIRKDLIEEIIVETVFKTFENPENLEIFIDKIIEVHNSQTTDTHVLNLLEHKQRIAQKSLDNILNCLEQGIISHSTKERLSEIENELSILNEKIAKEKEKVIVPISKEDVLEFINTTLKEEPEMLIRVLVKKILIYDDKVQIYFNYTNKSDPLDSIQEGPFYNLKIEKEIKNTQINGKNYTLVFDINTYV